MDRHYHGPAHEEGLVRIAILEENSDRKPLRGAVTTLSNRGAGLQLFCFSRWNNSHECLPVTRQRNAADVLILECLQTSNSRSATFSKKLRDPLFESVPFVTISTPPVIMTNRYHESIDRVHVLR